MTSLTYSMRLWRIYGLSLLKTYLKCCRRSLYSEQKYWFPSASQKWQKQWSFRRCLNSSSESTNLEPCTMHIILTVQCILYNVHISCKTIEFKFSKKIRLCHKGTYKSRRNRGDSGFNQTCLKLNNVYCKWSWSFLNFCLFRKGMVQLRPFERSLS